LKLSFCTLGGSSGSALVGAIQAIKEAGLKKGQKCVVIFTDSIRNYMTKFMCDQWMLERGFLADDPVTEQYSWWNKKVGDLVQSEVTTVSPNCTVAEAVKLMKKVGSEQLPVVTDDG